MIEQLLIAKISVTILLCLFVIPVLVKAAYGFFKSDYLEWTVIFISLVSLIWVW